MSLAGVAHCVKCGAVVNSNWKACASCSHPTGTVKKLISETQKKENVKENAPNDWLDAWRDLAKMTSGIQENDWRFKAIMDLLNLCDKAFEAGNWTDFQRLAEKANILCQKK